MFKQISSRSEINKWGLVYVPADFSFSSTVLEGVNQVFSLTLNDLILGINDNGEIDSISGLCPHPSWNHGSNLIPDCSPGGIRYENFKDLIPGISTRLNPKHRWPVRVNMTTGWVCLDGELESNISILISEEVIIELNKEGAMTRLWLKPESLPKF